VKDEAGEAKAFGNLGNTWKVLGRFDEALQCCHHHLKLARALKDQVCEARALYNMANAYHARGKQLGRAQGRSLSDLSVSSATAREVTSSLNNALQYYECSFPFPSCKHLSCFRENLTIVEALGDKAACGRAYGNIGNTYYLLGEFHRAVDFHNKVNDDSMIGQSAYSDWRSPRSSATSPRNVALIRISAMRMYFYRRSRKRLIITSMKVACTDCNLFCDRRALALAEQLGEAVVEAQVCYALGNAYSLIHEHTAGSLTHSC
jgi:G-protein signaling modulator 2